MITPRIKPSKFWQNQAAADLFIQEQRQTKLGSYVATLAKMDELIDFAVIAAAVDKACPRADRSKGAARRTPPRSWFVWSSCSRSTT